jgi:putative aldouronate transport system permease protein
MKKRLISDDKIFDTINTILLSVVLFIVVYPLYFVIIASISDPLKVLGGVVFLMPQGINLTAYKMVLRDSMIATGYKNTIIYTLIGTTINIIMTVLAAYPLSRRDFVGRNLFTLVMTVTMFFSGGLIPTYLLIAQTLKFRDTIWAMVLPGAVAVWNVIIVRTYFQTGIPKELHEAAVVDGCSNTKLLVSIMLPLAKPVLAVMVLFYGVAHWNSFFDALIYLSSKSKYPLQLVLRSILIQNTLSDEMLADVEGLHNRKLLAITIQYALIIVASAPVIAIYPFLQKYFIKGVMVGAIKG